MSAVLPPQGIFSLPAPPRPGALPQPPAPLGSSRGTGLAVVVGLHVLVGWALASGLAREAVEIVKKPIEMAVIPEVAPPPPPPPPPPPKAEKIREVAKTPPPPAYVPPPEVVPAAPPPEPVIQAVQAEPPKAPPVIEPPAPPAPPPAPVTVKQEISVACPGYQAVLAQALEEAVDRVGIVGTVRTVIKVRGSQVVDVVPQSGPKEYYKYLQTAIKRMRCSAGGAEEVLVSLDVSFKQ
ncbi:energy transducer TonB [Methylibium rhizosphaerae]|uniref:energy transducer TonB n=1 Tax=Methylibium rhizosphaerae TaxID=2570323 RepID=UPI001C612FDF|nr:energy transducer TonB [Methylibium rhizosphaerae]